MTGAFSDRDHLQTAWDALLREIETLQRATNYDPHPDDEINVSLTVAQAHALEEVADAALSARAVSHPPQSTIAEAEREAVWAEIERIIGRVWNDQMSLDEARSALTALRAIPAPQEEKS